ncbi:LpxI family protein [Glycocaulis sp.]|uniref:LpxI family protein n=1 Tax=Glycocaulis sp. TaxID=1969725 RepID=UPI0025C0E13F|nr:UDP-2,3-diacylglucosamine diphosphatase LpxI [Glycocaulis sp.]MCH8521380.1 UDP-2,3-diacylglucosamine diphosphatase LpxI [Glycocaulis sp.]
MAKGWTRLGLIAGGGALPAHVARAAEADGKLGCVIALSGFANPADFNAPTERSIGQYGHVIRDLRAAGCDAVCFAGIVTRPDFRSLIPDLEGAKLLPRLVAAAVKGDDALLRAVVKAFEDEGLAVIGADALIDSLLAPEGVLGTVAPDEAATADAAKAMQIAASIGAMDIGQGAVVCDGLVLAVEAQEGTDAMLARVAGLPEAIRGTADTRRGVLAKCPKPVQERRVDLPVVGVETVEGAARAGLAGIAVEAGSAFIIGHEAVARAADAHGLFVIGLPGQQTKP